MRPVVSMVVTVAMLALAQAQPSSSADVSQALAQIAKLEGQLDYDQALVLANKTIERGLSSHDQLADLNLIAGRLAAGLDRPDEAQAHFARVLALRPNTELIAGTSPKLQTPFDAARAQNPTLWVSFELRGDRVSAVIEHDSLHLVSGLRVTQGTNRPATVGMSTVLNPNERSVVEAIDEHGNELFWALYGTQRMNGLAKDCPIDCHRHDRHLPLFSDWKTYATVTGVALVVAAVSALKFRSAQDEWNQLNGEGGHDYSQLHALEDRGQRWAVAADISFGVTSLSAIATGVLFMKRDSLWRLDITTNSAAFTARF